MDDSFLNNEELQKDIEALSQMQGDRERTMNFLMNKKNGIKAIEMVLEELQAMEFALLKIHIQNQDFTYDIDKIYFVKNREIYLSAKNQKLPI